jgi:hypothetical protein
MWRADLGVCGCSNQAFRDDLQMDYHGSVHHWPHVL